jgi:hypothetical protein
MTRFVRRPFQTCMAVELSSYDQDFASPRTVALIVYASSHSHPLPSLFPPGVIAMNSCQGRHPFGQWKPHVRCFGPVMNSDHTGLPAMSSTRCAAIAPRRTGRNGRRRKRPLGVTSTYEPRSRTDILAHG